MFQPVYDLKAVPVTVADGVAVGEFVPVTANEATGDGGGGWVGGRAVGGSARS